MTRNPDRDDGQPNLGTERRLYWFRTEPGDPGHLEAFYFSEGVVEAAQEEIDEVVAAVESHHHGLLRVAPLAEVVLSLPDFRSAVDDAIGHYHSIRGDEPCAEDAALNPIDGDDADVEPAGNSEADFKAALERHEEARRQLARANQERLENLAESDPLQWLREIAPLTKTDPPVSPESAAGQAALIASVEERWWGGSIDDLAKLAEGVAEELFPLAGAGESVPTIDLDVLERRAGASLLVEEVRREAYAVYDRRWARNSQESPEASAVPDGGPGS